MPCDTIQTSTVELNVANVDILQAGLEADGHTVQRLSQHAIRWSYGYGETYTYDAKKRKLTAPQGADLNAIRRSYSRQVVRKSADRFGWILEQQSQTSFTAKRRF